MRRGRRNRIVLLLLVAALLVAAATALLSARDEVRAWRQAIVVGGIARGSDDAGARIARRLGGAAGALEQFTLLGSPATLIAPSGAGRVPAVVLLVPAGTAAIEEQRIVDLQRGLAAAGIAGWAVRLPAEDALLDRPTATVAGLLDAVAAHRRTRERRVSVLATGPAASIVLASASAGPAPRHDLRAVAAIEPVVDLRALVRDALVDPAVDPQLRARIGRLLARAARDELRAGGATIAAAVVERAMLADDPIAALRQLPLQTATGRLRAIVAVLQARDVPTFDAAWSQLPDDLRARVRAVSPLGSAASIDARVLLVDIGGSGPDELGDGRDLVAALPDARRVRVAASGELPATLDLLSVSAWWLQRAGA